VAEPALRVVAASKRFGGLLAVDAVSLDVAPGEVHAVIGPNGAGKTTLVNLITGVLRLDSGRIEVDGRDVTALPVHRRRHLGLGRSFQITSIFPGFTALENVSLAVQAVAGTSFRFLADAGLDPELAGAAEAALARVGLGAVAARPAGSLSHGEKRQLELAMALTGNPRLLLLDEPMAGTSPEESRRMVELIAALEGEVAVLLVEHDMDAVFRLADRITVLVGGAVVASDTPAVIRADQEVRRAYLGEAT
jgi:branched-chain amino acid transport system ATP-binding protein